MIKNLLFVSTSGIVLFSKVFTTNVAKDAFLGGVLTAILKMSVHKTGSPVSYIELNKGAIAALPVGR